MKIYIIYAHPAEESFCRKVLKEFCRGLDESGHEYEIGDLYHSGFITDMDAAQYEREIGYHSEMPVPDDVQAEQKRIDWAEALVFIYPVWWSDCPAKLKGWFDRIFSYGYAYYYDEDWVRGVKVDIRKALIICSAGMTVEQLEETGIAQAMRTIMIEDRLKAVRIDDARMDILGGMMPGDDTFIKSNLQKAYQLGLEF